MLDIVSLLVNLILQLHSRSTELSVAPCRKSLTCKLQMEPFHQYNHCFRHKFWIPMELEWMRYLLPLQLDHLLLPHKPISLVRFEAIQLGSSHISNFLVNSQTILASMECTTRIQCC